MNKGEYRKEVMIEALTACLCSQNMDYVCDVFCDLQEYLNVHDYDLDVYDMTIGEFAWILRSALYRLS